MSRSQFILLALALAISAAGVASIYSSNCQKEDLYLQDAYKRQALWVALGVIFFLLGSRFNYRRLWDWNYALYVMTLFLLALVYILGAARMGAQRWLRFAGFNFQPSEFAKLAVVIFIARYFSQKSVYDTALSSRRFGIFRGLILPLIFVAFPAALIIEQPDLGSGAMVVMLFTALLFLTGVKARYVFIFLLMASLPLPFLWHFLRDYQKERLLVFLNPNIDPLGAGYTIIQSKIAVGSGGIFGKGWLSGTQSQLHFLPEAHTDFIFAGFSEEWGLWGSGMLLLAYYLLIRQGVIIAQRTSDSFGRLLAWGISLMLALQVFINVAMSLGLAPVVGLPLPLMSYGGSSLVTTFIALGILASIDRRRAVF
jgi:rod shape determining protein RodA